MRISQKLEYACRALAQLAKRHGSAHITRLDELAQCEAVSANFLVQIITDLRRAGLVTSRRGKDGGYYLAKPPSAISLREIVEAVDPSLLMFSTSQEGQSGSGVSQVWLDLSKKFQADLEAVSLEDMAMTLGDAMFYI